MVKVIFSLFMILLPLSNVAGAQEDFRVLQRYQFVAMADAGKQLAILVSSLGPKTKNPNVSLIIMHAGNASPEYVDSKFSFGAGEHDLKELQDLVLNTNKKKLMDRGFDFSNLALVEIPSFWDSPEVVHLDPVNDSGLLRASKTDVFSSCGSTGKALDWKLCLDNGKCVTAANDAIVSCLTTAVIPQKVVRSGDVYWFVLARKVTLEDSTFATQINFAGIEL